MNKNKIDLGIGSSTYLTLPYIMEKGRVSFTDDLQEFLDCRKGDRT